MNGDYSRDSGRARDNYNSRHDRDDRRDDRRHRDRERDDRRRGGERDDRRERRRSRSPHGRQRREQDDTYSSSRDYRAREREDRYGGRRDDREWNRDRAPRRRDDERPPRRDRDLFDDRRGGGRPPRDRPDRDAEKSARDDRDEFAAQARGIKADTPPPKPREPTPDLTDVVPVLERKRRLNQWDIHPPGYENVTAEQAKLSGMFPLPGAPRAQMDAQKLQAFINQPSNADKSALKPQTARQAKRLFLHNLPTTATDQSIANWFNLHLNGLNVVVTNDSCISVNISVDKAFALVEFKAPEDTTMALALDGEKMEEHVAEANGDAMDGTLSGLHISRPKDYIVPTPEADQYNTHGENGISNVVPDSKSKIAVSHIPPYLEEGQVIELVQAFGELKAFTLVKDRMTGESRGVAFLEYANPDSNAIAVEGLNGMEIGDQKLKTAMASIGIAQAPAEMGVSAMTMLAGTEGTATDNSSRVVQLLNMVTPEELIDNDDYEEICEDIMEECQKYGKIDEMKIPRPAGGSRQSNGVGKIFLKYANLADARTAVESLAGRKFADRTVVSTYFDEASFEVNAW